VNALEVARAALDAAPGEAEAIAHVEHSGLARFAGSEIHQPTLIENAVVTLRIVRESRAGVATTNKVDALRNSVQRNRPALPAQRSRRAATRPSTASSRAPSPSSLSRRRPGSRCTSR
jgi:predicted Zn-dependent protease